MTHELTTALIQFIDSAEWALWLIAGSISIKAIASVFRGDAPQAVAYHFQAIAERQIQDKSCGDSPVDAQ